MKRFVVAVLASAFVGCGTASPVLYQNQKYEDVGRAGADRDIAECEQLADRAGATADTGKAGQAAKSAGVGAAGGAIGGSPGIGAAAGAASGAVWSLFSAMFGWMTPSQPSSVHMTT